MNEELQQARDNFIQGMSRISHFWGFPKAMGAIYGAIYLSPVPVSLDDLVAQVGVSKGAVSTNARMLERLGMVHKQIQVGDRKDYYVAETDFWKIVRSVLREREQGEFDQALRTVGESMALLEDLGEDGQDVATAVFYRERMQAMQSFFNNLDNLVSMLIALEDLRSKSVQNLFSKRDV
jgi:DNA-binding transcriptional regulator GbsR (MarR family)